MVICMPTSGDQAREPQKVLPRYDAARLRPRKTSGIHWILTNRDGDGQSFIQFGDPPTAGAGESSGIKGKRRVARAKIPIRTYVDRAADRKPVDPPPILQLTVNDPEDDAW